MKIALLISIVPGALIYYVGKAHYEEYKRRGRITDRLLKSLHERKRIK